MSLNDLLLSLGYDDNSELFNPSDKITEEKLYDLNGKKIIIRQYVIEYKNKKSYLNSEYEYSSYYYSEEIVKNNILELISTIKFPEPGKIYDVGWEATYIIDPKLFTKKERTKIAIDSFKTSRKYLNGVVGKYEPKPGDIIGSRPLGLKIDKGYTEESEKEGTLQRSILSKKIFSFGELKSDGMQYAMYDKDMNLIPI
jgi:hypothetical protein